MRTGFLFKMFGAAFIFILAAQVAHAQRFLSEYGDQTLDSWAESST